MMAVWWTVRPTRRLTMLPSRGDTRGMSSRLRVVRREVVVGLLGGVLVRTLAAQGRMLAAQNSIVNRLPVGCPLFPADNIWNTAIDALPVDGRSHAYIQSIGPDTGLHADFGAGLDEGRTMGIPFVTVPSAQPLVPITFTAYGDESDPGPYPVPADAPIEGGPDADGDRHVLVVQAETCLLYELFHAQLGADGWSVDSAAVYDLRTNALRPDGWTSADAAGLPILPGLVRYEEIAVGTIAHAVRFTAEETQQASVWPARHEAGSTTSPDVPPMGQRFRLKADVDVSGFSRTNQIILQALKTYGMVLADNGGNWFFSGTPDERWDNDDLQALQQRIHGADFEAVDCSSLMTNADSGQVA